MTSPATDPATPVPGAQTASQPASGPRTSHPPDPPSSKSRKPPRCGGEKVILKDQNCVCEEVDLGLFVNASRRMAQYYADLAAERTQDLTPFDEFMEMKRQFARFFHGANILNAEVSEAANPLLRAKDIPRLRCAMLALLLREAAVQCSIQTSEEIADWIKGGQAHE